MRVSCWHNKNGREIKYSIKTDFNKLVISKYMVIVVVEVVIA
jgi:hypothetical protein